MILTFDQAVARPWRTRGSSAFPFFLAVAMICVELAQEPAVAGGGRRAPLEAEGGHGHLPPVVDPADHVLLAGQRASVKKTSLNSALPSIWAIGRTSMPGWFMGTSR